jgi:probable rRNA maturation factor
MVYINEHNAELSRALKKVLKKTAKVTAKNEGVRANVSLLVTDDNEIRRLNEKYRGINHSTDVLSFPSGDVGYYGDIVISLEKAQAQANEYGHSMEREVAFLMTHAMLHLFGYTHKESGHEQEMRQKQREIMKELGYEINEV